MHCFHLNMESRSGVLCSNASPSNLRGSLLEGNKDHLLNQARSDLAKQELHVESLNDTDLFYPGENKFDHKKNCP